MPPPVHEPAANRRRQERASQKTRRCAGSKEAKQWGSRSAASEPERLIACRASRAPPHGDGAGVGRGAQRSARSVEERDGGLGLGFGRFADDAERERERKEGYESKREREGSKDRRKEGKTSAAALVAAAPGHAPRQATVVLKWKGLLKIDKLLF